MKEKKFLITIGLVLVAASALVILSRQKLGVTSVLSTTPNYTVITTDVTPSADNSDSIGSITTRWISGFFRTSVVVGNDTATTTINTGATSTFSGGIQLTTLGGGLKMATGSITGVGTAITGTASTSLTVSVPASSVGPGGNINVYPGAGGGGSQPGLFQIFGASGGGSPTLGFGSGASGRADIYASGGINDIIFAISGMSVAPSFAVGMVPSSVNYIQAFGGATGVYPYLTASGTDTNISMSFMPKGTGYFGFGTRVPSSTIDVTSSGTTTIRAISGGGKGSCDIRNRTDGGPIYITYDATGPIYSTSTPCL